MPRDRALHRASVTRYAKRNPDKVKRWRRTTHLRSQYGIELSDYERMLAEQGGVCAICARSPDSDKPLQVDHSHETGVVRGLLCHKCNKALGLLDERLGAALDYLEKHSGR